MPNALGLDDPPPLALPRLGRVARLPLEVLGPARGFGAHPRFAHQAAGALLQPRVAWHAHDVFDLRGLEEREHPHPTAPGSWATETPRASAESRAATGHRPRGWLAHCRVAARRRRHTARPPRRTSPWPRRADSTTCRSGH